MRRLTAISHRHDGERGAVSVIVAVTFAVLLGFGAMAVDVSMMFAERTQLQNGADAAALAIAQTCAKYPNNAGCSNTSSLAASLANSNANDKLSNVKSIALNTTSHTVTVTVGSQEASHAPNQVSLFFARIFGINATEVNASSTVKWGTPSKGPVILPLAIAQCKLNLQPGASFATEQTISTDFSGCAGVSGGFSWIRKGTTCGMTVTAGQANDPGIWFSSNTGASPPTACTDADISQLNDQTVLLPLYDVATGDGAGGMYYVKGFAAFHVTGYHFANYNWTTGGSVANKSIRGYFVKFVSLSEAFELGSAPDYGTSVVRLTQ